MNENLIHSNGQKFAQLTIHDVVLGFGHRVTIEDMVIEGHKLIAGRLCWAMILATVCWVHWLVKSVLLEVGARALGPTTVVKADIANVVLLLDLI